MEDATVRKQMDTTEDDLKNVDIYTCIDDIAKYPDKANKKLNTITRFLEWLKERECLVNLINGMCR